ncbi:OsmC family protein [Gangjinia marincola]|uniref:OsmC family protein n=1 Tax=Gangjinia marincola TaxID=578463 RepID=A0ABN1MGW2_9FLAO
MKRKATAVWQGDGLDGTGSMTTPNKVFDHQPYSFMTRFKNEDGTLGTNPEELLAASHAACFNMALSFQLNGAGFTPTRLSTDTTVHMDTTGEHFSITKIDLTLTAEVSDIDKQEFTRLATSAKDNCPISKALGTVPIDLAITLV